MMTDQSIMRLCQLRGSSTQKQEDLPALDTKRLEFACWLVVTGKLEG